MIARKCTVSDMELALAKTNEKFEGNVIFNRFEQKNGAIHFTLKVKDYKAPGHRLHYDYGFDGLRGQKRSSCACWHVHGTFFDELIAINENASIRSGGDKVINKDGGNWQDWNIGSQMFPVSFSNSCECNA